MTLLVFRGPARTVTGLPAFTRLRSLLPATLSMLLVGASLSVASATPAGASPTAMVATGHFGMAHPADHAPIIATHGVVNAALPASVNLTRYDVPVGNQFAPGATFSNSCVGFTIGYAMMGWWASKTGLTTNSFAPMYLYNQISHGKDIPTNATDGFALAKSQGVALESAFPEGYYNTSHQPTAAERANAAQFKIAGWDTFAYGTPGPLISNAIKAKLAGGQPVAITIPVRTGFDNVTAANPVDRDYTSAISAYHYLLAVGYNSTGLLVQNSYGTGWGQAGYGYLSWAMVNHDVTDGTTISVSWGAQTGAEWTQNRNAAGVFGNSRPLNTTGISKISGAAMHDGSTQFVSVTGSREYWQQRTAAGSYGSLRLIGTHPGVTSVAVASTPNGQLQVTSVIRGQRYFQIRLANGKWTKLVQVGHTAVSGVSAAGTPSGSAIYVLTVRGALYSQTRTASGRWSALTALHVSAVSAAAVTITSNNAQAQLVYDVGSRLYSRTRARSGAWSAPVRVGTAAATAISAAGFSDGSAQFVYLSHGNEYVQTRSATGVWTALAPVGNVRIERAVTATAARTGLVITSAQ